MPAAKLKWETIDGVVESAEECLAQTEAQGYATASPLPYEVVILATGYAALAAECLQALALSVSKIPVAVCRGHDVPAFVGPDCLAVAVSYSGATEEVIYAIGAASDRKCKAMVITGPGGHLRDIASAQGYPIVEIRGDSSHPSLELVNVFWTLLAALGPLLLPAAEFESAAATLALMRRQRDAFAVTAALLKNPVRRFGAALASARPVLIGTTSAAAAAARCWRALFHEIAGVTVLSSGLLETDWDQVSDWIDADVRSGAATTQGTAIVLLREPDESRVMGSSLDALRARWIEDSPDLRIHDVLADGPTALAKLWTAIHLGYWTAQYIAIHDEFGSLA